MELLLEAKPRPVISAPRVVIRKKEPPKLTFSEVWERHHVYIERKARDVARFAFKGRTKDQDRSDFIQHLYCLLVQRFPSFRQAGARNMDALVLTWVRWQIRSAKDDIVQQIKKRQDHLVYDSDEFSIEAHLSTADETESDDDRSRRLLSNATIQWFVLKAQRDSTRRFLRGCLAGYDPRSKDCPKRYAVAGAEYTAACRELQMLARRYREERCQPLP